ncbi:Crp/Fnr family transcriptional regulator [Paenibacillus doosanensis]|uniref:Fumarate and nitrate reduction regulatory protein n=1 Tax=Paenibacillus konkukensis TaxID=2020716 RepID=A0ABY4RY70_9BACL|nr:MULTISPECIES: Crp/Fnr family transcriptional regulator [Paenibacillus]MCS7459473.1 Crp/Fnr family transcriptional regulator [Paenibacillus doosanensis]UQZ87267.1 Fumarate and nitrate reduction regulatory protein [Paenibacillus konkukensis]
MILHKGETLFRQGETGPLYHVRSGLLKIVRIHEDGSPFLFNIVVPGETIPHHSLISPKEYHGTAIALVTSEITVIPAREWYGELERNPGKCQQIAMLLQSKLRMMQQRIDQLTLITPSEKLNKLEEWFAEHASPLSLKEVLTQEEIGQLIGLRRETVNRLLRSSRKS